MAATETVYRAIRDALSHEDVSLTDVLTDVDAAIDSYLTYFDEEGELDLSEVFEGAEKAEEISANIRTWGGD